MSDATSVTAADGAPLKVRLARATRRNRRQAFMLTVPLLVFILITFILPIAQMLLYSGYNPTFSEVFPRTAQAIAKWPGSDTGLPDEAVYAALAEDMKIARKERTVGSAATRVNYELPGARSLFTSTARKIAKVEEGPYKDKLIEIRKDWGDPEIWGVIQQVSKSVTPAFYLAALDYQTLPNGEVAARPEDRQIYVTLFLRTLYVSAGVTLACFVLGFPVAYLLATLPLRISNLLMIFVLLPFWTSLLVRTTAWIAILQSEGVLNSLFSVFGIHWLLGQLGLTDGGKIQMVYNMTGTIVAMTHILLPFMILPLFSVMKTIPPSYMRAARSLGATGFTAFRRVYFPQTLPGIGAGSLLVFILAIGYYITPALVGGVDGQLISNQIAFHMKSSLNWSLGAALGVILLVGVLVLYWFYNRIVGIDRLKLG